jgi:hypothetical protein
LGRKDLDPEFLAVVERARKRAAERGDWPRKQSPQPFEPTIPPEAADVIHEWLWDGGYDEVIAQITAEDADISNNK